MCIKNLENQNWENSYLSRLPEELLLQICSYLDFPSYRRNLCMAYPVFQRIMGEQYTKDQATFEALLDKLTLERIKMKQEEKWSTWHRIHRRHRNRRLY